MAKLQESNSQKILEDNDTVVRNGKQNQEEVNLEWKIRKGRKKSSQNCALQIQMVIGEEW